MSHPEQLQFFHEVAVANRNVIHGGRVVEIGAYDVNGNVRAIFSGTDAYVGVDLVEGPNVDVVGFGHEFAAPDASFDLAVSGECFEHDEHWRETFANMVRLVRPGGVVAFTCASRGRVEHGTARTDATLSPGTQHVGLDYYRNLEESDFDELDPTSSFSTHRFWYMPTSMDLYFAGVRRGDSHEDMGAVPSDSAVAGIYGIMSAAHKIVRMPLRVISRVLPAAAYQAIVRPYWYGLLALQARVTGNRFLRSRRTGDESAIQD